MNTTGQHLGVNPARDDKQKAPPAISFEPPPLIKKLAPEQVFIVPPPLIDNKLARRSYTQLQALIPPSEQLNPNTNP